MKKDFKNKTLFNVAAGVLIGASALLTVGAEQSAEAQNSENMSPEEIEFDTQFKLFVGILKGVERISVEEHSYRELSETAINAMIKVADPKATYINKVESSREKALPHEQQLNYHAEMFYYILKQTKDLAAQNNIPDVTYTKLVETALKAMLRSLDPHSLYLNEKEWKAHQEELQGEFGGIGISLSKTEEGPLKALEVMEKTPAQNAGILKDDLITHINGAPVDDMDIQEAVSKMRGKPKTSVQLTITRKDAPQPLNFTLKREVIHVAPVKSRMIETENGRIGYIKILQFIGNVDSNVDKAIKEMENDEGGAPSAYIIDVRNNPGGLLDQVADIADNFLEDGMTVVTKGRGGVVRGEPFTAEKGDDIHGKKLVVLTNANSASASEILASTLKHKRPYLGDAGRATIIGEDETTFGKGSVQQMFPIQPYGGVNLTIALYYAPEKTPQNVGVAPDIKVVLPPPTEEELKERARLRDAWFKKNSHKLTPEQREEFLKDKQAEGAQTTEGMQKGTLKDKTGATREMDLAKQVCELNTKEPAPASTVNKGLLNSADKLDVALSCAVDFLQGSSTLTTIKDRPAATTTKAPSPAP